MGSWVHGLVGSWVHEFMGSWVHGFISHSILSLETWPATRRRVAGHSFELLSVSKLLHNDPVFMCVCVCVCARCVCVFVCVCTRALWHNCNTSVLCSTAAWTVAHMRACPRPCVCVCMCVCAHALRHNCITSVLCSTATCTVAHMGVLNAVRPKRGHNTE